MNKDYEREIKLLSEALRLCCLEFAEKYYKDCNIMAHELAEKYLKKAEKFI